MKTALYSRVSTEDQTIEPQEIELREYCARQGWTVVAEYSDTASGTSASRPGLDAMFAAAERGEFEAVVTVRLDRIARSVLNFAKMIERLDKAKVAYIAITQNIDTRQSNPCGRFQIAILAAVAALERDMITERTKAGLRAARANGKTLGRPHIPALANEREIVLQWRLDGGSVRDLAARLGVKTTTAWRRQALYREGGVMDL